MATRTTTRTLVERGRSTRNPRCTRKNTYTNTYTNTNQPYPTPTLSLSPCLALPLSNTTWKNKKKNKKKNNTLRVVGLGRRCCACARHGVTLTRRQRQRDKVKANASRRDISDATWINEIHVSSGSVKAYDKELIKQQKGSDLKRERKRERERERERGGHGHSLLSLSLSLSSPPPPHPYDFMFCLSFPPFLPLEQALVLNTNSVYFVGCSLGCDDQLEVAAASLYLSRVWCSARFSPTVGETLLLRTTGVSPCGRS